MRRVDERPVRFREVEVPVRRLVDEPFEDVALARGEIGVNDPGELGQ